MIQTVLAFRENPYAGRVAVLYDSGRVYQYNADSLPETVWSFILSAHSDVFHDPEKGDYIAYRRPARPLPELLGEYYSF